MKKILKETISLALAAVLGFGGGMLSKNMGEETQNIAVSAPQPLVGTIYSNTGAGKSLTDLFSTSSTSTVADVAAKAAQSVVEIVTETVSTDVFMQQYISEGAGSGVILTSDGYIVTNNHVIQSSSKIHVTLKDGTVHEARLVGTDSETDIAVVKIDAGVLVPAIYGDSSTLVVGETAIAIGNPLGQLGGTVTDGIISALDREITIDNETMTLLQTNAAINPGNSGGGLFNSKGELIGIVNAKSSGSGIEGLGFAIPVNTAKPVIDDIIAYGYARGRIDTGLSFVDVTSPQSAWMYRVSYLGVYISKVAENSNAFKSGLRSGDLILAVDNKAITSTSDIKKALKDKSVGNSITLTVFRNQIKHEFTFTLAEYNPV